MLLGSGGGIRKQFDKFWYTCLCWDFLQSYIFRLILLRSLSILIQCSLHVLNCCLRLPLLARKLGDLRGCQLLTHNQSSHSLNLILIFTEFLLLKSSDETCGIVIQGCDFSSVRVLYLNTFKNMSSAGMQNMRCHVAHAIHHW